MQASIRQNAREQAQILEGCMMKRVIGVLGLAFAVSLSGGAHAQTLKKVQDRGALVCGVSQGLPGFSNPDRYHRKPRLWLTSK